MTYSNNRYDVTLGRFVERLEEEGYEIEDGEVYVNEDLDDMSNKKREVIRLGQLHDVLFLREIKALKDPEYAARELSTAEMIADEIKSMVEFLDIPVSEVDYVDGHVEIIRNAAKKKNINEDVDSFEVDNAIGEL